MIMCVLCRWQPLRLWCRLFLVWFVGVTMAWWLIDWDTAVFLNDGNSDPEGRNLFGIYGHMCRQFFFKGNAVRCKVFGASYYSFVDRLWMQRLSDINKRTFWTVLFSQYPTRFELSWNTIIFDVTFVVAVIQLYLTWNVVSYKFYCKLLLDQKVVVGESRPSQQMRRTSLVDDQ